MRFGILRSGEEIWDRKDKTRKKGPTPVRRSAQHETIILLLNMKAGSSSSFNIFEIQSVHQKKYMASFCSEKTEDFWSIIKTATETVVAFSDVCFPLIQSKHVANCSSVMQNNLKDLFSPKEERTLGKFLFNMVKSSLPKKKKMCLVFAALNGFWLLNLFLFNDL